MGKWCILGRIENAMAQTPVFVCMEQGAPQILDANVQEQYYGPVLAMIDV